MVWEKETIVPFAVQGGVRKLAPQLQGLTRHPVAVSYPNGLPMAMKLQTRSESDLDDGWSLECWTTDSDGIKERKPCVCPVCGRMLSLARFNRWRAKHWKKRFPPSMVCSKDCDNASRRVADKKDRREDWARRQSGGGNHRYTSWGSK